MSINLVTCNACGWVHFSYTRKQAEQEVEDFNNYFDTLTSQQQQDNYGGRRSSINRYETCDRCGGSYTNFRPFRQNDCPDGCTITPIIHFNNGSFSLDALPKEKCPTCKGSGEGFGYESPQDCRTCGGTGEV